MPVRYLCDSCGFRGLDALASSADEVLCETCGEPVLADPDIDPSATTAQHPANKRSKRRRPR